MKISLILLAAGNGRRFGSNKLLYELNGKEMYRYAVDEIASLDDSVFVGKIVVSQYDKILDALSEEGYQAVRNTESELGLSRSIQLGIEASGDVDAWCFLVADQPYLKAETVRGFVDAFQKSGKSCASVCHGERLGNPCIFTKSYRGELMALEGDTGGKKVIRKHLLAAFLYEVEDEKELQDIDS